MRSFAYLAFHTARLLIAHAHINTCASGLRYTITVAVNSVIFNFPHFTKTHVQVIEVFFVVEGVEIDVGFVNLKKFVALFIGADITECHGINRER